MTPTLALEGALMPHRRYGQRAAHLRATASNNPLSATQTAEQAHPGTQGRRQPRGARGHSRGRGHDRC